ncbi:MAG TPA: acetolactate synthase 2 small subunit [Aeromonadales bacterium]|nr:acetolactate synthase 2 small subunit [Aeromonadales bacterium]
MNTTTHTITTQTQSGAFDDEKDIFNLALTIKNISGSLERIIRTIRHRGFDMIALNVSLNSDATAANLAVQVRSDRKLSTLTRQLEKLFDVQNLQVLSSASEELGKVRAELNFDRAELDYAKSA